MGHNITQTKLIMTGILLFAVVLITAYLQPLLHLNTLLALAICLADTIVCAMIIFG